MFRKHSSSLLIPALTIVLGTPAWRTATRTQADAETHTNTRARSHRQTDAHTLDSFTVRDKWCLTLWPGEMGWLSSSEMKILLTKVPWAKQVVSLGNLDADFCSSRATCQSKHPPNNHFESWRTLSPRHKLVDWQLNGRMCSADIVSSEKRKKKTCRFHSKTNQELGIYFTWIDLLLHALWYSWIFFLISNCRSECLPFDSPVDKDWCEFKPIQRTFNVMSVFCAEKQ